MGQVVRDIGMTLLVALVIHALYAARHMRSPSTQQQQAEQSVYAMPSYIAPAAVPIEQPPAGFSVFPWAP